MEPITYANGSTLEDPAISYGIVFSNFMSKGVFTFEGGTDRLIGLMEEELRKSGVDIRIKRDVDADRLPRRPRARRRSERPHDSRAGRGVERESQRDDLQSGRRGVFRPRVRRRRPGGAAEQFEHAGLHGAQAGRAIDESTGDLLFSSTAPVFRTELLLSRDITSRTYSFYYPRTRPEGRPRCLIVSSTNANYDDWANLSRGRVRGEQAGPGRNDARRARQVRAEHPRADRPRRGVDAASRSSTTRSTSHGASFGTKFEGLAVSRALPQQIAGLYHAGSVGIIMSGWLGAMNYGVIVANEVDSQLMKANTTHEIST